MKTRLISIILLAIPVGLAAQVSLVKDLCTINQQDYNTGLGYFIGFNNYLYYNMVDFCWASGTVRTDGTAAGTTKAGDYTFDWLPSGRCVSGGHLYYGGNGWLRRINGTTGEDELVKEGLGQPRHMADISGVLVFSLNGSGIWRSDGTEEGTYPVLSNVTGIARIVTNGNHAYIGTDEGIWRTDGTATGTELILPNTAAPNGTTVDRYQPGITVWSNELYLIHIGSGPDENGTNVEIYNLAKWSNNQITLLTTFTGSSQSKYDLLNTRLFYPTDHGLYFIGSTRETDGGNRKHNQIWRTNGTAGGTAIVKLLDGAVPEYFQATSRSPEDFGNLFFFPVGDNTSSSGLWRSDGTEQGTYAVTTGISGVHELAIINNTCYFMADDGLHGNEVWKSDGSLEGTSIVEDLYPGPESGAQAANYTDHNINSIGFNGRYYFIGKTPDKGVELYATGGNEPVSAWANFTLDLGWCQNCDREIFRVEDANNRNQYMNYALGDAVTQSGARFTINWDGSDWIGQYATKSPSTGAAWQPEPVFASNGLNTSPKPPCTGWTNGLSLTGDCTTPAVGVIGPPESQQFNTSETTLIEIAYGKNSYAIPLTNGAPGEKLVIRWNNALSRWEMVLTNPSARTSAETILSYNTAEGDANPPCSGWTGSYGLSGDICIANGTLPVTLVGFSGQPLPSGGTRLVWSTASEFNTGYFGIEFSRDAIRFEEIGRNAANGNSNATTNYVHHDEVRRGGRNYYRLRIVDLDETFSYSSIIRVTATDMTDIAILYPNPVKDGIIRIEAGPVSELSLQDTFGREIPFARRTRGKQTEIIPHQQLQPGIYIVRKGPLVYKAVVE